MPKQPLKHASENPFKPDSIIAIETALKHWMLKRNLKLTTLQIILNKAKESCNSESLKTTIDETVNQNGMHLLHICVSRNKIQALKLLLKLGANPNIQNNNCDTPLHGLARKEIKQDKIFPRLIRLAKIFAEVAELIDPNIRNNQDKTFLDVLKANQILPKELKDELATILLPDSLTVDFTNPTIVSNSIISENQALLSNKLWQENIEQKIFLSASERIIQEPFASLQNWQEQNTDVLTINSRHIDEIFSNFISQHPTWYQE